MQWWSAHTRAVSGCGAPFIHGVPGSTHSGTLVTTPLAHGASLALGVSSTHGVALTLAAPRTQRLSPALCVRRSTHFATLVYTHCDTTHTGTTLTGTTLALASTRAHGVFTPPKLRVHPSAALTSTSRGTTEFPWS